MTPYPLIFRPILKEKVWGGRFLAHLGKSLPEGAMIGESWELADLPESIPDGRSAIANGPLARKTLREMIDDPAWGAAIMGAYQREAASGFPLLIKYLDAQENLSVQVHPDEAYCRRHPEAHLKSEAWFVVDAEPGAVIYKGMRPGLTRDDVRRRIAEGRIVDDLIAVPAIPGNCHYLPSGTVHALGAGIVVAEVQTPSDTTFRIYDWGRPSDAGRKLHIDEAAECMMLGPVDEQKPHPHVEVDGVRTQLLVETEHFSIERMDAMIDARIGIVTSNMPEVWMVITGIGQIKTGGKAPGIELLPGVTTLIPAAMPEVDAPVARGTTILRITLPSPLRGMLAR